MTERARVAVVGATGYTGGELLRWLVGHPRVEVVGATARARAGERLADVWPQFYGNELVLSAEPPPADVVFLCTPHAEAHALATRLEAACIVDLSGAHRLDDAAHAAHYGFPRAGGPWVYGLPELGVERVRGVARIANPGCFATALALALLPLRARLPARVPIVGITGSTGSGAAPKDTTHHPVRAENVRPYKVLDHQHVPEVEQAIGGGVRVDFVPMSGPYRRGILVTATLPSFAAGEWESFYAGNPLVRVRRAPPELLHVLGGPRADVGVIEGDGVTVAMCAIDNLCRGAATQAIVNMNLHFGWPMTLGLDRVAPVP